MTKNRAAKVKPSDDQGLALQRVLCKAIREAKLTPEQAASCLDNDLQLKQDFAAALRRYANVGRYD